MFEREVPIFSGVTMAGESPKIEMKSLEEILNMTKVLELA